MSSRRLRCDLKFDVGLRHGCGRLGENPNSQLFQAPRLHGAPAHAVVSLVDELHPMKEAAARIKINKLLENAGWRFFADAKGPANIQLEPSVTLKAHDLDALGENFEKTGKGLIDFLLLNEKSFPSIVLEAKAEDKSPLAGKEQARRYAKSQNCRFVILSNGNLHYFWDLERGNPYVITAFPSPTSVTGYQKTTPNPKQLIEEIVGDDYVVLTQRPGYATEAAWKNEAEAIPALKTYFKAYVTSDQIRHIIETGDLTDLATNPVFSTRDFKAVPKKYRALIPDYIKDYVSLNQFVA